MATSQNPRRQGARKGRQPRTPEKAAGEYAKEAISEWRTAAKLALAALPPVARDATGSDRTKGQARAKASLRKRLGAGIDKDGGRLGTAVDAVLSKMGAPGKAAAKLELGSRVVAKLRPDSIRGSEDVGEGKGFGGPRSGRSGEFPVPIQEAIDIAVPVRAAYSLATGFEDYPEFLERVEEATVTRDGSVTLGVRVRGQIRKVKVELTNEQPEQRIEWESSEGPGHAGTISFHELASRLTHVELSVDMEPSDLIQRFARAAHLTERAIRAELRRFKAYAELWQDEEFDEVPNGEAERENAEEPEVYEDDEDEEPEEPEVYEEDEDEEPEEPEVYEDEEDEEPEEPEAYEEDYEDELTDEPTDEAYVDETADPGAQEAYEEVAR